jgi:hypothetical protein
MPFRSLCVLAVAGTALALAGCSSATPLGPDAGPSFPPARHLGSPIVVQLMRGQPPTSAGQCPASTVSLYGDALVPRVAVGPPQTAGPPHPVHAHHASTASSPVPTPGATGQPGTSGPLGVACYRPAGSPVTITSARVTAVSTYQHPQGPATYGFAVAFPSGYVAALTTLVRRAYASGDALGMTVAGKLWQAPQPRTRFIALRAAQVNLLSRSQAIQLYHLLVPSR